MKVLVTGATGFLGSHTARVLQARGAAVVSFSRASGGDVLDPAALRRAAEGCDAAIHCAGPVSMDPRRAEELYRVHVEGTKNVLDACEERSVRRVVVASTSGTCAVSEDAGRVGTEEEAAPMGIVGRWPYYRAKLFSEQAALRRSRPGFDVLSVNPSLLLGPGDLAGSSTASVRLFLSGRIYVTPAGGLSFVDVRDVADAIAQAIERGRAGERYLLGACNLTVRDFLSRLSRLSGVPAPLVAAPRSRPVVENAALLLERLARRVGLEPPIDPVLAAMGQYFWYVDASKAERELAFRPRDPSVTLRDTIEDLRSRGVVWPAASRAWARPAGPP